MPEFRISEETRRTLEARAWTTIKLFYREMRVWKPRWLKIAESEKLAKLWEQELIAKEKARYEAQCSASSRPSLTE